MPANRPFKNRLRGYFSKHRKLAKQPIPLGFAICPPAILRGMSQQQLAFMKAIQAQAYAEAQRTAVPFYLQPILNAQN
jgi:hypothetical protein